MFSAFSSTSLVSRVAEFSFEVFCKEKKSNFMQNNILSTFLRFLVQTFTMSTIITSDAVITPINSANTTDTIIVHVFAEVFPVL